MQTTNSYLLGKTPRAQTSELQPTSMRPCLCQWLCPVPLAHAHRPPQRIPSTSPSHLPLIKKCKQPLIAGHVTAVVSGMLC